MARMRSAKQALEKALQAPDWREQLPAIAAGGVAHVGPLFSFLLKEPLLMHRSAVALGQTVALLAQSQPEAARNVVRRFMWHMNEESGNIGWGIPEAFGETLSASPLLAKEFHRVLISYIIDLGRDDNFCDHAPLRRSCYWAIGRLLQIRPELGENARIWLRQGLEDEDILCRGMAAWALGQLPMNLMDAPALRRLADAGHTECCLLFDGENVFEQNVSLLAQEALMQTKTDRNSA